MNVEFKNKTKTAVKLRSWSEGTYTNAIVSETKRYPYIKDAGGEPPTPVRPDVPQTGTWQLKTTPTKGYIILGKDDDTQDQAIYTRLINGYGYPVTINTSRGSQYNMSSNFQTPDIDSEFSQYPEGSVSRVPEKCSVHDLNMIILENNLGEVAQHGGISIWDSSRISDSVMDEIYTTYTNGGGTKTKSELLDAMREVYSSSDANQNASSVFEDRAILEEQLGYPIYTLGEWGSTGGFVIDGITVCARSKIAVGSHDYARSWNYWGDGPVTNPTGTASNSPYNIHRYSHAYESLDNTLSSLNTAYNNNLCVEMFCHQHFTGYGTEEQWTLMKTCLDKVKEYVDDGKIEVVTRYKYSQLGEFVQNPITTLEIVPDQLVYEVGDTITETNFTCNAVLEDNTKVVCSADRILDISGIDTSSAGTYTVYLKYRGFKTSIPVTVSSSAPTDYILENKSYSGDALASGTQFASEELDTFVPEVDKVYHFEFDIELTNTVRYAAHSFTLSGNNWGNITTGTGKFDTTADTTVAHISADFTCVRARVAKPMFKVGAIQNTTVTAYSITNLYCWEVTE